MQNFNIVLIGFLFLLAFKDEISITQLLLLLALLSTTYCFCNNFDGDDNLTINNNTFNTAV